MQLVWGGIPEHDAFLGHDMRGPAGTERVGVLMAGGREGQGARKGNGVRGHRLPSPQFLLRIICCSATSQCCEFSGGQVHPSPLKEASFSNIIINYIFFIFFFIAHACVVCVCSVG